MMRDTMMGIGKKWASAALVAVVCGCGGGGGGGGGNTGGAAGASGTGGACSVNSTFQGQPGTLWVERKGDGQLTSYDTQTGKELTTIMPPGPSNGLTGGNGLLWLRNINNDKMVTPIDPTGKAFTKLPFDPDFDLAFASGKLWTMAFDAQVLPNVYAITSPTSITALPVGTYTDQAYTASSEGFFFLGAESVVNPVPELVYVDAAASKIVWHVSVKSSLPDLLSTGPQYLAVLAGKVYVKMQNPDVTTGLFSVDIATQTVSAPVKVEANPGIIPLMTDGKGLYDFDAGKEILYEIDPTTGATKRKLELGVPASGDQTFIDNSLVAAGAIWLGRNCGGKIYNRRIDLESWTIADFEFKQAQGVAPQGYAYLAP